jgi:hypothetical protein
LQVRFGLTIGIDAVVLIALRDGVGAGQLLAAFVIALGEDETGLRSGDLCIGAGDFGGVKGGIDHDKNVVLLNHRAFTEADFLNRACHPRAHFDLLDRFKAAGEFIPDGVSRSVTLATDTAVAAGVAAAAESAFARSFEVETRKPPAVARMAKPIPAPIKLVFFERLFIACPILSHSRRAQNTVISTRCSMMRACRGIKFPAHPASQSFIAAPQL